MLSTCLTLAGLLLAQAAWCAPGDAYMPGRLSVRFFEQPRISRDAQGLNMGIPSLDAVNRDFDLLDIVPLYQNLRRVTVPDLSLNYLLAFPPDMDMEALAAMYETTGSVEYAEPDYIMPVTRVPDDPSTGSQWFLDRVEAYEAWDSVPETPSNPDMVIAVIDSGNDWNHPDLINRIWINPEEDLDGDGEMPDGEIPGDPDDRDNIDDDSNGLIDDFYGWDWVVSGGCHPDEDCSTPDNNPMDFDGHGTHCSGIAAAQTDNGVGVASVVWDARIMCLRAGYHAADGNGYVIQSAAANGIYYAIDIAQRDGNKTIISMSFGGSGTLRTPATVAWNSGLLCFHAAGNDDSSTQDQLDRASGIVSVAATTQTDCKSDYSNYGEWVDVSAPGDAIYSTIFNDTYSSLYGTSMACPLAASVAALIWTNDPELDDDEDANAVVRERLLGTVDGIDHLACNSDYQGLLGTGRVNAYKAINNIRETTLSLDGLELADSGGDGRYLNGENVEIVFTVSNTGINPTETVYFHVSCADAFVDIPEPVFELPYVLVPDDGYTNTGEPVLVELLEGGDPRYLTIDVFATTANADTVWSEAEIMVGQPDYLLYDDDGEESPVYTYYYAAMKELDHVFDWYRGVEGEYPLMPDLELDFGLYEAVIYASGSNESTLDAAEQILFTDYAAGGDLLFSCQHADTDLEGTDFFANVLKAVSGDQTSNVRGARGVEGDPYTAGLWLILQGAGGAMNQDIPVTEVQAGPGATEIFLDNNSAFPIGLHTGMGENRLLYLNFALEAASGAATSQSTAEVLNVLLPYLLGEADVIDFDTRPSSSRLAGIHPNPFNPQTRLVFELAAPGRVELTVCNVLGQEVALLESGRLGAGRHTRPFRAAGLPSGIYFASFSVDGERIDVRKMLLAR